MSRPNIISKHMFFYVGGDGSGKKPDPTKLLEWFNITIPDPGALAWADTCDVVVPHPGSLIWSDPCEA